MRSERNAYDELFREATDALSTIIHLHGAPLRRPLFWRFRARRAVAKLRQCLILEPQSWPCLWFIGKAYQALGDHARALRAFIDAAQFPHGNPDVFREASVEACSMGDGAVAVAMAQRAVEHGPRDAGLLGNLALAYLVAQDVPSAKGAIAGALELAPDDPVNRNVDRLVRSVAEGRQPCPRRVP